MQEKNELFDAAELKEMNIIIYCRKSHIEVDPYNLLPKMNNAGERTW